MRLFSSIASLGLLVKTNDIQRAPLRLVSLLAAGACIIGLVPFLHPPHNNIAMADSLQQSPRAQLDTARKMHRNGTLAKALPILNTLLYPQPQLGSRADLLEAHLLLGVAHFLVGDEASAQRELTNALFLDPELALDPNAFQAKTIAFFQAVKIDLQRKNKRDQEVESLAKERDRLRNALDNMVVIEKRPYYINFIPFGAGQFQNDHNRKGVFFFSSEVLFGGTSLGLFVYQWLRFGIGGRVPREDVDSVRRLQQLQIATGAVSLGLVAWGIVDALLHYQPTIQRKPNIDLLPKGWDNPQKSFRVSPAVLPQGGGLILDWRF